MLYKSIITMTTHLSSVDFQTAVLLKKVIKLWLQL